MTSESQYIRDLVAGEIGHEHFFCKTYMFEATRSQMVRVIGMNVISNVIPSSSKNPDEYQVLSTLAFEIGFRYLEQFKNHNIVELLGNPGDTYSSVVVHIELY